MTKPDKWLVGLVLIGLGGAALAAAPGPPHDSEQRPWTTQPLLEKVRGFNRSMSLLRPVGLQIDAATVLPSVASDAAPVSIPVPLRDGKLMIRTRDPKQGGYYRVTAMEQGADKTSIAGTMVYFSNPGPAPRAMLAQSVMPLEILPVELPREHRHYRAGETWSFQLRREGRPLADHPLLFESAQGSRATLHSDARGRVELTFPEDFPEPDQDDAHGGHRGGPRSAFVLSASLRGADGRQLTTAFNDEYRPGAYAGKSLWLGGGFAVLGMLTAIPLVRRRQQQESAR